MVQIKRIESFIRRCIWRLTRSTDIIKYVPKSIKNGVIVGDCAVIRNHTHTYDVFSKHRIPIKKDIANYKVAVCIATISNQFTETLRKKLNQLLKLDKEFGPLFCEYLRLKLKKNPNKEAIEFVQDRLKLIDDKINVYYKSMTL
jgi:hypothetical protein|tara:strand:+ start:1453 stop:1884 length:432 start_codon:yes stop_codon:yes gene_type:complete